MMQDASKKDAEITLLRERLLLTLRFYENAQEFRGAADMRRFVLDAANKRSLRDLRLLAKEIDGMAIALQPHEREGLNALLESRLGVNREQELASLQAEVRGAIDRGTIRSEKERRRLEEYLDLLESSDGDQQEIVDLKRLLSGRC